MNLSAWLLPKRPQRLLILFGVFLAIVGVDRLRRWWTPTHARETAHYRIQSSAQTNQTIETGARMEVLYSTYVELLQSVPTISEPHAKLQVKLYRDRNEFKRCNRVGWAEAFYRAPFCHAYFSADEINPHHWMLHEGVHQLNHEVARLRLAKWAEEGLAEYFSTSQLRDGRLELGLVDRNTYPVWWLEDLQLSNDLDADLKSGRVIPLRVILNGHGGPSLDDNFNLYYLHWWSLTHLLFDGGDGKYRDRVVPLVRDGASLGSFEKHIGSVEQLQTEWYQHLQHLQWSLFRVGNTNYSSPRSVRSSSLSPK